MRIVFGVCLLCLIGCGSRQDAGPIVARVNNYAITADELKRELASSRAVVKNYPGVSADEVKDRILDDMILRQLLLEEAQKLDVDKEKAFMYEVEGYWRQALLKALLAKKNEVFLAQEKIADADVRALYARESAQVELDLVTLADEGSARMLSASGENFEAVIQQLGAKVVARSPKSWWSAGDFAEPIEQKVWALNVGDISPAFLSPGEGWIVAMVTAREQAAARPFEEMAASLRKRIARQRAQKNMDRWIGGLKGSARIEKYADELNKITTGVVQQAGGQHGK